MLQRTVAAGLGMRLPVSSCPAVLQLPTDPRPVPAGCRMKPGGALLGRPRDLRNMADDIAAKISFSTRQKNIKQKKEAAVLWLASGLF